MTGDVHSVSTRNWKLDSGWWRSVLFPKFERGVGWALLALGVLVLYGWYAHNLFLLQIRHAYSGMQFNTALMMGCSGVALLFLSHKQLGKARLVAATVVCFTFLTGSQYLAGISLGIDQLFFTYNLDYPMEFPGRMALNTATVFVLLNTTVFLLTYPRNELGLFVGLILSEVAVGLTSIALLGYGTGLEEMLGWGNFSRMGIHTAFGLCALGIALSGHALAASFGSPLYSVSLPLSALALAMTATFATWQVFRTQEYRAVISIAERLGRQFGISLETRLEEYAHALDRFAERWQVLGGYPPALWEVDARNYVEQLIALDGIQVFGKELQSIYSKALVAMSAGLVPSLLTTEGWQLLRSGRQLFLASTSQDLLLVLTPLLIEQEWSGLIVAEVNMRKLLAQQVSEQQLGNYRISLLHGERVVASFGNLTSPPEGQAVVYRLHPEFGDWSFHLFFTKQVVIGVGSGIRNAILWIGTGGALLTGLVAWFGQRVRARERELEQINETLVEARRQADTATVAKSAFLASMSHEIRTPLNTVVGTVELLAETSLNSAQQRYVSRIVKASEALLNLVNEILDISRIEAGKVELTSVPTDFGFLLKGVADSAQVSARAKLLDVLLDFPSQPLPIVFADPLRLTQVASNLLNNALKFTDRGTITIRVRPIRQTADFLLLRTEVIDTGIGIDEEGRKKLFQPFSKIEAHGGKKPAGVGLGLSIAKKLVQFMGGEIGLAESSGPGATFWFTVPFKIAASSSSLSLFSGKRIWLHDDREKERELIQRYLTDWGAKVVSAPEEGGYDAAILSATSSERLRGDQKVIWLLDEKGAKVEEGQSIVRPITPLEMHAALEQALQGRANA